MLEQGEVLPVGATKSVPINVRIIAAANRELAQEVAATQKSNLLERSQLAEKQRLELFSSAY